MAEKSIGSDMDSLNEKHDSHVLTNMSGSKSVLLSHKRK